MEVPRTVDELVKGLVAQRKDTLIIELREAHRNLTNDFSDENVQRVSQIAAQLEIVWAALKTQNAPKQQEHVTEGTAPIVDTGVTAASSHSGDFGERPGQTIPPPLAPTTQRERAAGQTEFNQVPSRPYGTGLSQQHLQLNRSQQYPQLNKDTYPTVIFVNGAWHEIWCHICGANAFLDSRKRGSDAWFKGIYGMNHHVTKAHHDHELAPKPSGSGGGLAQVCGKRALSDEDVDLIRNGQDPNHQIINVFVNARQGQVYQSVDLRKPIETPSLGVVQPLAPQYSHTLAGAAEEKKRFFARFAVPSANGAASSLDASEQHPDGRRGLQHNHHARPHETGNTKASDYAGPSAFDTRKQYRSMKHNSLSKIAAAALSDGTVSADEEDDEPLAHKRRKTLNTEARKTSPYIEEMGDESDHEHQLASERISQSLPERHAKEKNSLG